MNLIKDYRIIESYSRLALKARILECLEKGWKLQGGVSIYNGFYCQAIIKEKI